MHKQSIDGRRSRTTESSHADLNHWKRLLDELPDVRLDKVRLACSNLERNHYDDEQVLRETIRRLSDDIGIPCCRADLVENDGPV